MVCRICSILPNPNHRWLKGSYLVKNKVTYVVHLLMFGFSEMTNLPIALQDDPIKTKMDDWEFKGLFGVLLVDNVEEQSQLTYNLLKPVKDRVKRLCAWSTKVLIHLLQKSLLSLVCGFITTRSCLYSSKQSLSIFELIKVVTGPGISVVDVPSAFIVVLAAVLNEFPFSMTSHRA
ncbi:hypothetical protein Tco_1173849 [Tanacetum coccineum]